MDLIVFLPVILFVAFGLLLTLVFLSKADVTSLFTECIPQPDEKEPIKKASSSRVILFLSGFTAIIISISLMTYYLHASLYGKDIDQEILNEVMKSILYLGIGIIPYGANQMKGMFQN